MTIEIEDYNQRTRFGSATTDEGESVLVRGRNFKRPQDEAKAKKGVRFEAKIYNGIAHDIEFVG